MSLGEKTVGPIERSEQGTHKRTKRAQQQDELRAKRATRPTTSAVPQGESRGPPGRLLLLPRPSAYTRRPHRTHSPTHTMSATKQTASQKERADPRAGKQASSHPQGHSPVITTRAGQHSHNRYVTKPMYLKCSHTPRGTRHTPAHTTLLERQVIRFEAAAVACHHSLQTRGL